MIGANIVADVSDARALVDIHQLVLVVVVPMRIEMGHFIVPDLDGGIQVGGDFSILWFHLYVI